MTTRNFHRPDDEDSPESLSLEPPTIARLLEIHVPTLIIVGDEDVRDILAIADILEAGLAGAKKVVIPGTAHQRARSGQGALRAGASPARTF